MHFEHYVSSYTEPQRTRAGVAHREVDGGEYHPSTKVFYQVSLKLPRPASPSTPSIFEGEFGYNARGRECRQAMQTRRCGGIPADLTFLVLFWSSKKVQRESHERLLNEVGRASMHALTQGTISLASGGNFWQGAATGMASSLIGSATSSFPVWAQIGVSTVTGGATSKLSGGTFWEGAVTGFAVSAFNHAMDRVEKKIIYDRTFKRPGAVPLSEEIGYQWAAYKMRLKIIQEGNGLSLMVNVDNSYVEGDVVPSASATLMVNGKEVETKTFSTRKGETYFSAPGDFKPLGEVNFVMPDKGNVSIKFQGGWNIYMNGGAAVPVYHPIFYPRSININKTFIIR